MSGDVERIDIHAAITAQIIAAVERGAGAFHMPWHRAAGSGGRPRNIASGRRYRGVNVLALWLSAEAQGYPHPVWGTYRQWQAKDAQVRKGERGARIIFYRELTVDGVANGAEAQRIPIARSSVVFNAAQVEGYEPPDAAPSVAASLIAPLEAAETLIQASGADIREGGDRACYVPSQDRIMMPDRHRFAGSPTMSPTEAWYATELHELVHWTGAPHRLDRALLASRFGDNAYAMEELVAELGASYLCADLGVTPAIRPDHAAYVQGWLTVMRADKRAIVSAAARAQAAATFLLQFAPPALREPDAETTDAEAGPAPQRPTSTVDGPDDLVP